PGSCAYNVSEAFRLSGPLNISALTKSVGEIARRHESLRTSFISKDGRAVPVIAPELAVEIPVVDLSPLEAQDRISEAQRVAIAETERAFDLARGPLFRIRLIRLGGDENLLVLTMHHIVSDGWSLGVFFRELETLYRAFDSGSSSSLPDLKIQYADYAAWQQSWLRGETLERQLTYWKSHLSGAPRVLDLAPDRHRSTIQSAHGAHYRRQISAALTEELNRLSRREGVTLFMTLLATFETLIMRWTGREDIVLGTDIANRRHVEIEPVIGFFVNLLVLRTDLSGNPTF